MVAGLRILRHVSNESSKIGLVLGGGGITGAAYQFAVLRAIRMATGWDPGTADVIVGTSAGAVVAAMARGDALTLHSLVGDADDRNEMTTSLQERIYPRTRVRGVGRWVRWGVLPHLRQPGLGLALGSPAIYHTGGVSKWLDEELGDLSHSWPTLPTVIVGYDLEARKRVPFGTEAAPDVALRDAVAASAAVPAVYQPVRIDDRWYVDGGVASGTSADLLLANERPLDLIVVVAPMAAPRPRPGARFYEDVFDKFGREALAAELAAIRSQWPDTEIVVLRPAAEVLEIMRPNPLAVDNAVPVFRQTLRSLRHELSRPGTWSTLVRHLPAVTQ